MKYMGSKNRIAKEILPIILKDRKDGQWVRDMTKLGHKVFVSEYNAPDDFKCVWEKQVSSSLSANGTSGGNKKSIEKLFIYTQKDGDTTK